MCLVLLAYRVQPDFPLIVAANRDEFFDRPSKTAHFWIDNTDLFGGRDLQEGGTWLGVTRRGRFGAITNWTESENPPACLRSRGMLVKEFLEEDTSAVRFIRNANGSQYRGFNLVLFDGQDLIYWSNRDNQLLTFTPGIYAVSNTSLNNTWLKTQVGKSMISELELKHDVDALIQLLRRHTVRTDVNGAAFDTPEKDTSPCFILGDIYGTRSSTAVVFDETTIQFKEQEYGPQGKQGSYIYEQIKIEKEEVA